MANVAEIITGLETEIRVAVCGLTPNYMSKPGFTSPKRLETVKLEEQTQVTRLFQVEFAPETIRTLSMGCADGVASIEGTITIGYPVETKWNAAMSDDFRAIYDELHQNRGSVSGVSFRHVPDDAEPEIENVDNDWRWMRIPVIATFRA